MLRLVKVSHADMSFKALVISLINLNLPLFISGILSWVLLFDCLSKPNTSNRALELFSLLFTLIILTKSSHQSEYVSYQNSEKYKIQFLMQSCCFLVMTHSVFRLILFADLVLPSKTMSIQFNNTDWKLLMKYFDYLIYLENLLKPINIGVILFQV